MSFKSQKELWEHLIAGGRIRHKDSVVIGQYYELGENGFLLSNNKDFAPLILDRPSDWQIYQEPKPKRKITLHRYTVKVHQSGEVVQTAWADSFHAAVRGLHSCTAIYKESKEIEFDKVDA